MTPQQLKWIEALESGNYQQGRAALNNQGAFCCLGVACEIAKDELKLTCREKDGLVFYDDYSGYPPDNVAEYFGLHNRYGQSVVKNENTLGELNDKGYTFKQIVEELKTGKYFK